MADYIEFEIAINDDAVKEILIARLSEAGAEGFEESKGLLKVYIPTGSTGINDVEKIIEENGAKFYKSIVKDKNWNEQWESDFKPVSIGSFCAIRASFHPENHEVLHDIVITPKMSFGTGHHATTHLMVKAMQKLDFKNQAVFDFGTGTGVLAILAEKCGASSVQAIDNDAWSIENATENFNVNNCHNIMLSNSNSININGPFNIILANINRNIILRNLGAIQQHLVKNGVVLLSGLLTGDEQIILEQACQHSLQLQEKSEMDGWICLLMVNG